MIDRSGVAFPLLDEPRAPGTPRPVRSDRPRRLRVVDVAIFYGERSGGIRTYLEAKAAFAARTGRLEHHLVIPGRATVASPRGRHEQRSLRLAASNGYRVPLGGAGVQATLRRLQPDIVLLHDPFWTPRLASRTAHECGAIVIAVHHSSADLHAAGLPGPHAIYAGALRRWYRHAYGDVDAVMSVVDPVLDTRRARTLRLRLGVDPAFVPGPGLTRGDHVLYVGRLSREKGLRELLEAVAAAREPWPLTLVGTGPAGDSVRDRAGQLGLGGRVRFVPYISGRDELARTYGRARCAVLPGAHETFGLAALEAAACGTPVVTAASTPAARLLGSLGFTFPGGDSAGLRCALERARARPADARAGTVLATRHSWEAAMEAELADLHRLLGRGERAP